MSQPQTLMVVHAHPDDEVFSTGGTLARYARAGVRTVVVYCTNGEEGDLHNGLTEADRERLGEIRVEEARRACALLGVDHAEFLGYRDSGMKDTEPNARPDNFLNAPLAEATERLLALMQRYAPQVVITYDEEGGYGHPDHVKTNRVTVAAFEAAQGQPWAPRKLYYSARSREGFRRYVDILRSVELSIPWIKEDFDFDSYGKPDEDITACIDVSSVAPLKKQALATHRSQIPEESFYLRIPDDIFPQAQNIEYFVRIEPPHAPGEREDDLFAGLQDSQAAA